MWFSLSVCIVLLNWMDVVNPVTVATTICCHGCQSWALGSENGRWAWLHLNLRQGFFLFFFFFLYTVKLCAIVVYVSVYESRGAFRRICIIHCTLIMDQFLSVPDLWWTSRVALREYASGYWITKKIYVFMCKTRIYTCTHSDMNTWMHMLHLFGLQSVLRPLRNIIHYCQQTALHYRVIVTVSIFIDCCASSLHIRNR